MRSMDSPAHIAVIGAGAVGGLTAAFAREAGLDVTLCLRSPLDELTMRTGGEELRPDLRFATSPGEVPPADWVFLTTKVQDTEGAAGWLRELCGPGTAVAVVQNGVDHEERVRPLLPEGTELLPALAYMAVERVAPGRIVHHFSSELHVPEGPAGDRFALLLEGSRLKVRTVADFRTAAWRKLFTNVAANPLTTILKQRMHILGDPEMHALAEDILREGVAVARAEGADVSDADAQSALRKNTSVPPDGGTSMLYDRLAGRPLEHEHITGAVVRAAERHGIDVPLNRMLLTMLRAVDRELRAG
ncbi:putative 2-dehydropantoate 2-reductase [Streptomyces daqingensis]|uniref:2-dehydropantoate 2-reductase n=1 Tax=Streptomyces daqingensis TaxID=1472640 RepID=A0ABQ2LTK3_9ACTN|nr:2-dehydropantoate 2-reductase [Streptomyces daqingensis]GGO43190.1 putative 2-dehydropantoate 2-reductase [Streptomyces daqingensis]